MAEQALTKEVTAFHNLIDTYVRYKNHSTRDLRAYEYYHPSEWGKCLRKQQYKHYAWIGKIKFSHSEFPSRKIRLFDKGHNMHRRWSEYFDDMGNVLMGRWKCQNRLCLMFDDHGHYDPQRADCQELLDQNRTRVYGNDGPIFRPDRCMCGCKDFEYLETKVLDENIKIKGNADLVINCDNLDLDRFKLVQITCDKRFLPINGRKVVIDMKTASSSSWKNQIMRKGPHPEYIIQLTLYVFILQCDYGLIIYENKDESSLFIYKVERDEKLWEVLKFQATEMVHQRSRGELPPPKAKDKKDRMCYDCEFKKLCHKSAVWSDKNLDKWRKEFYLSTL